MTQETEVLHNPLTIIEALRRLQSLHAVQTHRSNEHTYDLLTMSFRVGWCFARDETFREHEAFGELEWVILYYDNQYDRHSENTEFPTFLNAAHAALRFMMASSLPDAKHLLQERMRALHELRYQDCEPDDVTGVLREFGVRALSQSFARRQRLQWVKSAACGVDVDIEPLIAAVTTLFNRHGERDL